MSVPLTTLQNQRVAASEKSGGISSDPIYDAIKRVIVAKDLRGEILDYGAGVGHLSERLLAMQQFQSVTGADLRARPPQLSANFNWIRQDLNAPIPGCDSAFDVVVAAEVIEHLENPRFVIRECYRLLRPGGLVIITTPNNESWRSVLALVSRGHFVAFSETCYPAHITALLRKDFGRMFAEAGFCKPEFHFTNRGGIPTLPSVTWQAMSFNLLRGLRFSDNILACAHKPA